MGRLYPIERCSFFLACCCAMALSNALAEDFCSLRVQVTSPDGRRPAVPVKVREENGRVQEKEQDPSLLEDPAFCDLGILPVSVTVGSDGMCNQVTVRDVPVSLDRPYVLRAIYDPEACEIWEGLPAPEMGCQVLLRIKDSDGGWVANARIEIEVPVKSVEKADRYGRASLLAKRGSSLHGAVSAENHEPTTFRFTCSERRQEHFVELKRR